WMLAQEEWENTQFVQIRHSGLREALGLENERVYYSPAELSINPRVGLMFQDLRNKRDANEKLDPFFQAVQTLESQLSMFHAVRLGLAPALMPSDKPPEENPTGRWANVSELKDVHKDNFNEIVRAFA